MKTISKYTLLLILLTIAISTMYATAPTVSVSGTVTINGELKEGEAVIINIYYNAVLVYTTTKYTNHNGWYSSGDITDIVTHGSNVKIEVICRGIVQFVYHTGALDYRIDFDIWIPIIPDFPPSISLPWLPPGLKP